jgi:hypothetical protein
MITAPNDALADAIARIPPGRYHEIRAAYYKAAEGLRSLADALEQADLTAGPHGVLIDAHLLVCQAIDAMTKTNLGQVV